MGEVLYAGGELDSVYIVGGTPSEQSGAGVNDSTYSRCAILCNDAAYRFGHRLYDVDSAAVTVTSGDQFFSHYRRYHLGAFDLTGGNAVEIMDSSGYPWVALRRVGGTTNEFGIYGNTGTGASPSWTKIGSGTKVFITNTAYFDDIRVEIGADGVHTVEWAVDQTQTSIGTFTNAAFTNIAKVEYQGIPNGNAIYYSQMLATKNLSTIGGRVFTSGLSGAGTNADWSGAYTDINEVPLSDVSTLQTSSAGDVSTFATSNITTPTGYVIPSLFVWSRIKNSGAAPVNADVVIRTGGTDYPLPIAEPSVAFANIPLRQDTNPADDSEWTDTVWNAAERGIKSET